MQTPATTTNDPAPPTGGRLGRSWMIAALCLLTIALLTISFAPYGAWFLAYVALVPWTLAVVTGPLPRRTILIAALAGLVYWLGNLYWLIWVTPIGYGAGSFYLTFYWIAAALLLRPMARRGWPMWLCLPVIWVSLEFVRAHLIGFPWSFLAHSQYGRISLIQIADLTGQYGVSFAVAMVNGLFVDLLLWRLRGAGGRRRLIRATAVTTAVFVALIGYGQWRLGQDTRSAGPRIGVVQQAVRTTLAGPERLGGVDNPDDPYAVLDAVYDDYLAASEAFVDDECDLVVWPEGVLPYGMNPEVWTGWREIPPEYVQDLRDIARLSIKLDCPILAGGGTYHADPDRREKYLLRNSALWFDRTHRAGPVYSKMHLVPFSEYVPFKRAWPWLHGLLRRAVPPSMEQNDPGPAPVQFTLRRGESIWHLAAPICYEGTFARVCRQLVTRRGRKSVDLLANMSNDGWFVWPGDGGGAALSAEHAQHLVSYCFRAVENRVPVIRAVNTGISASIDSEGRIVASLGEIGDGWRLQPARAGRLLLSDLASQADDVTSGPRVLVDSRESLYSLMGDLFAMGVSLIAAVMAGVVMLRKPID